MARNSFPIGPSIGASLSVIAKGGKRRASGSFLNGALWK